MNPDDQMARVRDKLISTSVGSDSIEGCTEEELADIIAMNSTFSPPGAYVAFMRCMGKKAGRLLRGTDVFYPGCLDAFEVGVEVFPGGQIREIFLFGHHQGYQFYYFKPNDQHVYLRTEDDDGLTDSILASSFCEFISKRVDRMVNRSQSSSN
ncbi:hypothetical protein ACFOVU_02815 [Nocardiopsis sediminis]|uniref:SMI1/KNR4 family protein n=1 Tax=Nocardiopsis sediminis TaxID=1778267 RepID=A0ABV8FID6_9ACTN